MTYNHDAYENAKIEAIKAQELTRRMGEAASAGEFVPITGPIPEIKIEEPVAVTQVGDPCPRCGAALVFVTSSPHCSKCGYHEGCCG